MKIGIYEQIINQLFEEKISSIDQNRFYIGERVIKKDEVAKLLSMYLTSIFEQVLSDMVDINDETDEEDEQKGLHPGRAADRRCDHRRPRRHRYPRIHHPAREVP